MGGADCCGKVFLVITNVFIIILGVVFLAGGLFLKFGQTLVLSTLSPLLESALSQASSAGVAVGSTSSFAAVFDVAAYVLIALGAISLVIAVFGCAGACCSENTLLALYAAVILLMIIAEIVMIAIIASKVIDQQMFDAMTIDLKANYQGPLAFNTESLLLNALMVQLGCCGIKSYTEFLDAVQWNRTLSYTYSGQTFSYDQQIPMTCCKVNGAFPSITPIDTNCTITPTSVNANIQTSCSSAVQSQVDQYKVAIYGIYAAILVFQLLCSMVAVCLLVRMKKKENKVHPDKNQKGHKPSKKNGAAPDEH